MDSWDNGSPQPWVSLQLEPPAFACALVSVGSQVLALGAHIALPTLALLLQLPEKFRRLGVLITPACVPLNTAGHLLCLKATGIDFMSFEVGGEGVEHCEWAGPPFGSQLTTSLGDGPFS